MEDVLSIFAVYRPTLIIGGPPLIIGGMYLLLGLHSFARWVILHAFCGMLVDFKIRGVYVCVCFSLKTSFQIINRTSNSLDPDHKPGLVGPNCLQLCYKQTRAVILT